MPQLSPNEAFVRLRNGGAFAVDEMMWYWHQLGNGFKIMACRSADGLNAPTLFHEFHEKEAPLTPKRYF